MSCTNGTQHDAQRTRRGAHREPPVGQGAAPPLRLSTSTQAMEKYIDYKDKKRSGKFSWVKRTFTKSKDKPTEERPWQRFMPGKPAPAQQPQPSGNPVQRSTSQPAMGRAPPDMHRTASAPLTAASAAAAVPPAAGIAATPPAPAGARAPPAAAANASAPRGTRPAAPADARTAPAPTATQASAFPVHRTASAPTGTQAASGPRPSTSGQQHGLSSARRAASHRALSRHAADAEAGAMADNEASASQFEGTYVPKQPHPVRSPYDRGDRAARARSGSGPQRPRPSNDLVIEPYVEPYCPERDARLTHAAPAVQPVSPYPVPQSPYTAATELERVKATGSEHSRDRHQRSEPDSYPEEAAEPGQDRYQRESDWQRDEDSDGYHETGRNAYHDSQRVDPRLESRYDPYHETGRHAYHDSQHMDPRLESGPDRYHGRRHTEPYPCSPRDHPHAEAHRMSVPNAYDVPPPSYRRGYSDHDRASPRVPSSRRALHYDYDSAMPDPVACTDTSYEDFEAMLKASPRPTAFR